MASDLLELIKHLDERLKAEWRAGLFADISI